MRIKSLLIRRFRSIASVDLRECGALNVFIGKNNAGKSNILSTITLVFDHLAGGTIVGPWNASRTDEQFTDRNTSMPLTIGIQFEMPNDIRKILQTNLPQDSAALKQAVEVITNEDSISFIVKGVYNRSGGYLYVAQIGVGPIEASGRDVEVKGHNIITVPADASSALNANRRQLEKLRSELRAIEGTYRQIPSPEQETDPNLRAYFLHMLSNSLSGPNYQKLREAVTVKVSGSLRDTVAQFAAGIRQEIEVLESTSVKEPLHGFSGLVKEIPPYIEILMRRYGGMSSLHYRETKEQIGKSEADELLKMRMKKGGQKQFDSVNQTVSALLGVNLDVFANDAPPESRQQAEMNIDDFLVEANGAGIREALRLILDLELKRPKLVLIEEPEVHLHPGLERVVESYLRQKSKEVQVFLTTHSTSFVDSLSLQNVYLVTKGENGHTSCEQLATPDDAFAIPAELGLRLSTVFMYDRLVFVEGPSDEHVLRMLAKTLGRDLAKNNVGFVQMGGVRNFVHFAAGSTLSLLSRRQIKMWFVCDRDEKEDSEVGRMLSQLQGRAECFVLGRRELENYLLDPHALTELLRVKHKDSKSTQSAPDESAVRTGIAEEAEALKDEAIRLRVEKKVLRSIHLQGGSDSASPEERIQRAIQDLDVRLKAVGSARDEVLKTLEAVWPTKCHELAPGALILDKVARRFGLRFNKEAGDSERLAAEIEASQVHPEIQELLKAVTS